MKMLPAKFTTLGMVVGLAFAMDWWTKALIRKYFTLGREVDLISPILAFTHVRNRGAAFSFMDSAPASFRDPFFTVVPIVALLGIFLYFRKLDSKDRLTIFSLSLIAGGALGNLVDRLRFGWVTDFIDVHWKDFYHWPRFNVADSCIVIGVGLLLLSSLKSSPEKR